MRGKQRIKAESGTNIPERTASQRPSSAKKPRTRSAAEVIAENTQRIAAAAVERHYKSDPNLRGFGARRRAWWVESAEYHLEFLLVSMNAKSVKQFIDYCGWAKILLHGRGINVSYLIQNLKHLRSVLKDELSTRQFADVSRYLQAGIGALPELPVNLPTRIAPDRPYSEEANLYFNALLHFDHNRASDIVLKESSKGVSVKDIYRYIITPVQHEIGRLWQMGKLSVVHEHYCTAATEIVMAELFRHVLPSGTLLEMRLMAFCVEGERHSIALRMFADLMRLEGWQVQYVGQDTPTESAIRFICEEEPTLVAVSVTFAKNLRSLERLVRSIRENPISAKTKILIGGAAASNDICKRLGANGYAESIGDAVEVANRLVA